MKPDTITPRPPTRHSTQHPTRHPQRHATLHVLGSALALTLGLAACGTPLAPLALAAQPAPPKLVVFIAVDGLPMRQVTGYRTQLAPDGLARFLDHGTWFAQAHHGHAYTVTAAGHATMLTGAYPQRSGIIGNEWRDPNTGLATYNTGDTRYAYIGHATRPLDGTSPNNLRVETVGDVLRRVSPMSKVMGISGKDRGAILPAGKAGTAYMFMDESGQFASSTYYMQQHPAWVDAFHAGKPADRYFKATWTPLLPAAAYAADVQGTPPWFSDPPGTLPMALNAGQTQPTAAFYNGLRRSPAIDALSLDFARAAIAGEQLGQRGVTDLISISLSGHDYVNHAWSAESAASHDHLLQLDRLLQDFFRTLDATLGKDSYLAVLTADHGFMPAPEHSTAQGNGGGRQHTAQTLARLNAVLEQRFNVPRLARFFSASSVVLDRQLMAQRGLDADRVAEAARKQLLTEPGIDAAYTRRELLAGSLPGAPFFQAMQRAWHPDLSGDVQYVMKPLWMMSSSSTGTTHGSPHRYDTHVPILVWGPAWAGAGRVDQPVSVADIAPTLARMLGIAVPAGSQGQLLPLLPAVAAGAPVVRVAPVVPTAPIAPVAPLLPATTR